jgi:hypothetical protein
MNRTEELEKEITEIVDDCTNWDSEYKALREATQRGIELGIKQERERLVGKAICTALDEAELKCRKDMRDEIKEWLLESFGVNK